MKSILTLALITLAATGANALDLKRLVTPETIATHRETLALTPEQEAELTRLYDSAKSEAKPLEEAVKKEEDALNDLLRSQDLETSAAETNFAALLEAETKLKHLQFKTLLSLRAVLTADQIEKAVSLEHRDRQKSAPVMASIEGKAERLKAAFDELELKPSPALEAKGGYINGLIESGDLAAADKALDDLAREVGIDEPIDEATIDFGNQAPGKTDSPSLEARYAAVESAVRDVTFLPTLRQLLQARDALEAAKSAEDAEGVGRVLTWAENLLGITSAP